MDLARKDLMNSEKRNHERKNLASDQIEGIFSIVVKDEKIVFDDVHDVSISGMGIRVDHFLDKDVPIEVCYESDDFNIAINAEIAWQEKLEDNSFRIGVQFSNENMDGNVMLFMTMREYIDDFGEAF